MKRILLLHASVGMGHLRAASAIASAFQDSGQAATMVEDSLSYTPDIFRKVYAGLYLSISERTPDFWSFFYKQTDRTLTVGSGHLATRVYAAALDVRNLGIILNHTQPSAIICTHFLPIEMINSLGYPYLPPVYCVLTDYHAHPFWKQDRVTRYFVPTETTQYQLAHLGIDQKRISVTGIPIHSINASTNQSGNTLIKRPMAIQQKRTTILLILSGLPLQRARGIIEAILLARPLVTLLVAVGRNQSLAQGLLDLEWRSGGTMQLIGAQANLDEYLSSADIVISKAGGLTLSEILAHGKPMLIPLPVAGQESFNAQHAIQAGAALGCINMDDFVETLTRLQAHPTLLKQMADAALALAKPLAAKAIAHHVLTDLQVDKDEVAYAGF